MSITKLEAQKQLRIAGRVDEVSAVGLFKLLETGKESGRLRIVAPTGNHLLWIKRGKLIYIKGKLSRGFQRFLLVHNRFMTGTIYDRLSEKYLAARKNDERVREGAGHFLDYLVVENMLTPEHRDEVHRLLTEWQALALLGLASGRFEFEPREVPDRYAKLPSHFPERIIWRFEQLVDRGTPLSDGYPWQRGLHVDEGTFGEVPFALLLNTLKHLNATGFLVWRQGFSRKRVRFYRGMPDAPIEQWRHLFEMFGGRYRFNEVNLRVSRMSSTKLRSRYFGNFFDESLFESALSLRSVRHKTAGSKADIKQTTSMRAWVEVQLEDFWLYFRPTLRWLLPLALPMILVLLFSLYQNYKLRLATDTGRNSLPTAYSLAAETIFKLSDRQHVLTGSDALEFSEHGYRISVERLPSTKPAFRYLRLKVSTSKTSKTFDLVDIRPEQDQGHIIVTNVR